jgi:hypothetical protein
MDFTLDEDAWKWTATEWMERFRTENRFVHWSMDPDVPSEAKHVAYTPVWKLIARHMYQMDIDAELSKSPA